MKHILIPTCFTHSTLKAIQYIVRLFPNDVCNVTLLHVIKTPDSITELLLMPREEERLESVNDGFAQTLEQLKKKYALEIDNIQIVHAYGEIGSAVEHFAADHPIDLIISAEEELSENTDGLKELLNKTNYPLLCIPIGCEAERPRKIAFFQEKSRENDSEEFIRSFYELAQYYRAELLVVCAIRAKDQMDYGAIINGFREQSVAYPKINFSFHFMAGDDALEGVTNFLSEFNVDMIVAKRKKKLFSVFSYADPLEGVARYSRIPFLAMK